MLSALPKSQPCLDRVPWKGRARRKNRFDGLSIQVLEPSSIFDMKLYEFFVSYCKVLRLEQEAPNMDRADPTLIIHSPQSTSLHRFKAS